MEPVQRQGHQPLEVAGRPHVGRNGEHIGAQRGHSARHLAERGGTPSAECKGRTLARERDRQCPPQAARSSGDKRHLSFKPRRRATHPSILT